MDDKKQPVPMQGNINLNMDVTPVHYVDFVVWNISGNGVVLNFGHAVMGSNQVKITARVGMSKDFLSRFLSDLGKNLVLTEAQGQTGKQKS